MQNEKSQEQNNLSTLNALDTPTGSSNNENELFRIRKLATSGDVDSLKKELAEWSGSMIDNSFDKSGKNILHHAAWRGPIGVVEVLLNHGANINFPSIGEFSYGKSPIFFAATRCRDDMTMFLLSRGASVNIVNNKGQSVLSIASTHLKQVTIDAVKTHESPDLMEWVNYRATHSDGRVYGDLEPRFMERPLVESDVVTSYAINPTTHITRKGNFARNNPGKSSEELRRLQNEKDMEHTRVVKLQERSLPPLSQHPSDLELHPHLNQLERLFNEKLDRSPTVIQTLCILFDLYKDCKSSWLPDLVCKISKLTNYGFAQEFDKFHEICSTQNISSRNQKLLKKCLHLLTGNTATIAENINTEMREGNVSKKGKFENNILLKILPAPLDSLPLLSPPKFTWVDTPEGLSLLKGEIEACLLDRPHRSKSCLAIDTEWITIKEEGIQKNGTATTRKDTIVATIQVAIRSPSGEILCWVVDALCPSMRAYTLPCSNVESFEDSSYTTTLNELLVWMWNAATPLGFAVDNDIEKLQKMVPNIPLSSEHCIDIQKLSAKVLHCEISRLKDTPTKLKQLPGLKYCVGYFMKSLMSKKEQMSDWRRRPLSQSQLLYAALDAVILIPLLDAIHEKEYILSHS